MGESMTPSCSVPFITLTGLFLVIGDARLAMLGGKGPARP